MNAISWTSAVVTPGHTVAVLRQRAHNEVSMQLAGKEIRVALHVLPVLQAASPFACKACLLSIQMGVQLD